MGSGEGARLTPRSKPFILYALVCACSSADLRAYERASEIKEHESRRAKFRKMKRVEARPRREKFFQLSSAFFETLRSSVLVHLLQGNLTEGERCALSLCGQEDELWTPSLVSQHARSSHSGLARRCPMARYAGTDTTTYVCFQTIRIRGDDLNSQEGRSRNQAPSLSRRAHDAVVLVTTLSRPPVVALNLLSHFFPQSTHALSKPTQCSLVLRCCPLASLARPMQVPSRVPARDSSSTSSNSFGLG